MEWNDLYNRYQNHSLKAQKNRNMKTLFTLALISLSLGSYAQSYTDCSGNSETLNQWLSAGTPVIVASKGVDCSICMSSAPAVGTFASSTPQVRVWAAMTYRYSNQDASCAQVNQWISSYGWSDVFAFADVTEAFKGSFFSRYIVYALDGSVAYDGPNFTTAGNTALGLVSGVGLAEGGKSQYSVLREGSNLVLSGIPQGESLDFELIDLAGRTLLRGTLSSDQASFSTAGLRSGIHLLRIAREAHKVML
jgi:hypothetical protein